MSLGGHRLQNRSLLAYVLAWSALVTTLVIGASGVEGDDHARAMTGILGLREQQTANDAARTRNAQLQAEVSDLKEGLEMVEEKARAELGMVKPNEILVQVARR